MLRLAHDRGALAPQSMNFGLVVILECPAA